MSDHRGWAAPAACVAVCLAAWCGPEALGAGADNTVEWNGVGHVAWQDLRPLVPLRSDAFEVRFQAYRDDLTAARVAQTVSGVTTWHPAAVVGQVGPYDVWSASLPGTSADEMAYLIEVADGTDVDYLGPAGVSDGAPAQGFAVNFVTLAHAPVGATPVAGGTVFKVWAPTRTTCHVRGQFNSWSTANPLTKSGDHFVGFVPGATVGQMYKYFFNNSVWNTDPRAAQLNPADNANAVITDPLSYQWQHDGFVADPLAQMVIYQLHVGTFAGRNDPAGPAPTPSRYRDVGNRADHLAELGVNAVMVNPINEFPGSLSGGYAPISQYAWETALGTPDDLKYMVDELHERGIAVILDAVWNHFSPSDNFLWNYDGTQLYYDSPAQDTPWGAQADFDDPGVFSYFLDSVHHVMGEFRMDGYRQDAVMFMTDSGLTSQWGSGQDLVRAMNLTIDRHYADAVSIAEIYIDSPWVQTGIWFDTQYHNEFKEALRSAVFDAGLGNPNMTRLGNVLDGSAVTGTAVLNYFELHDDAWPLNGHERAVRVIDTTAPNDDEFARGRTTLAHGLVLLAKGVPAILQGTEWLENDGWEANKIDWSHKTTYAPIFAYYQSLIALRTSQPALFADAPAWVYHINDGANVLAFERYQVGGESFVVVANLSNSDWGAYRLGLPRAGTWGVEVSNQAVEFGGTGAGISGTFVTEPVAAHGLAQSAVLSIPARGLLVLRHNPPGTPCNPGDLDADADLDIDDVSAFVNDTPDITGDTVFNVDDVAAFVDAFSAGCP